MTRDMPLPTDDLLDDPAVAWQFDHWDQPEGGDGEEGDDDG